MPTSPQGRRRERLAGEPIADRRESKRRDAIAVLRRQRSNATSIIPTSKILRTRRTAPQCIAAHGPSHCARRPLSIGLDGTTMSPAGGLPTACRTGIACVRECLPTMSPAGGLPTACRTGIACVRECLDRNRVCPRMPRQLVGRESRVSANASRMPCVRECPACVCECPARTRSATAGRCYSSSSVACSASTHGMTATEYASSAAIPDALRNHDDEAWRASRAKWRRPA